MALRNPQALLGTFIRAGVLCLVTNARTCLTHGLGSTPDSILFSPINLANPLCIFGGQFLESWDPTSLSFVNSASSTRSSAS